MSRLASHCRVRANTPVGAVCNDANLNNSPMYGPGRPAGAVVVFMLSLGHMTARRRHVEVRSAAPHHEVHPQAAQLEGGPGDVGQPEELGPAVGAVVVVDGHLHEPGAAVL